MELNLTKVTLESRISAIHLNAPKNMHFRGNPHSFHGIPRSFYQFVQAEKADSDFNWKVFYGC